MKVVPLIPVIIGPIYAENSYDEIPQDANLAQYTVQLIDEGKLKKKKINKK